MYNEYKPQIPYPKRIEETIRKMNPTVDDVTIEFLSKLL